MTLRHIVDVEEIRNRLGGAERAAIIGDGYIGLEVTALLRTSGLHVTAAEGRQRLMTRVVSEPVSRFFEALHGERGVQLRLGAAVERIVGRSRVEGVQLGDGNIVPADIVLVAIGSKPNDELAAAAGLVARDGILVDTYCRTAAPDILAAGDCTRFWSGRYRREIRLESVQNAIDQAKAAALTMLGNRQIYDPLPLFWSDQYDFKLQIVGLSEGYDRIRVDKDVGENCFAVYDYLADRLLVVDAINAPRAYLVARQKLDFDSSAAIQLTERWISMYTKDKSNPPTAVSDGLEQLIALMQTGICGTWLYMPQASESLTVVLRKTIQTAIRRSTAGGSSESRSIPRNQCGFSLQISYFLIFPDTREFVRSLVRSALGRQPASLVSRKESGLSRKEAAIAGLFGGRQNL